MGQLTHLPDPAALYVFWGQASQASLPPALKVFVGQELQATALVVVLLEPAGHASQLPEETNVPGGQQTPQSAAQKDGDPHASVVARQIPSPQQPVVATLKLVVATLPHESVTLT